MFFRLTNRPLRAARSAAAVLSLCAAFIPLNQGRAQSYVSPPAPWVPAFEVASIRPNRSSDLRRSLYFTPDGVSFDGIPLGDIVHLAFVGTHETRTQDQILGVPGWAKNERFDIHAKLNEGDVPHWRMLSVDQQRLSLLPLLVDRCHLRYHHESRIMQVYVLSVDKVGSRLRQSHVTGRDASGPHMFLPEEPGHLDSHSTYIWQLIDVLERQTGSIVLDQTGLDGSYDYALQWTPDLDPPANASGPSLTTAVKEQLGLRLALQKTPMDIVVVDHLERPSAN